MDLAIFQAINNLAGRWFLLDQVAIFLASGAGYGLLAILGFVLVFRSPHRRMVVIAVVSAVIARFGFVELIRHFYHRTRPISVDAVHQLVVNDKWAFPSGHASFFFALAMGVYLYNRRWGIVFFAFATLMGLSRIFIGVHWPSDILAGAILGIATAWVVKRVVPPVGVEPT